MSCLLNITCAMPISRLIPEVGNEEKDISILHYGAVDANNRQEEVLSQAEDVPSIVLRHNVLSELKKRGISIHVAGYNVWGANLTLLIRRSKIVLNLHYYDARTLETCRIMESLSLGALVISEPGADEALRRDWEDKIVFAESIDAIEEALKKYSTDEQERQDRQRASWKHAQQHYALQKYLGDILTPG
ncbi:g6660 [Coccomyxa viridis]|uniref:G6660 protein n=1 Tax=Coccomyxa viridis TaxID=1274662 RepID=A0ABP1G0R7_9CHLO